MKILVCISNVPDTTTKIKFTDKNTKTDVTGIQWIINPWDELALTRALELKEQSAGFVTEVNVISVGGKEVEPTIRKALAIGADKGFRVNAEAKDANGVAFQLAEAIRKEHHELVLAGIESSDFNGSSVGIMLAEYLNWSSISSVSGINLENGAFNYRRELDGGYEILQASFPLLAVVQKGIAKEPRIPSMRGVMASRTKPLAVIEPVAIDLLVETIEYELPSAKATCKKVDPENMKELVALLHNEAKVI